MSDDTPAGAADRGEAGMSKDMELTVALRRDGYQLLRRQRSEAADAIERLTRERDELHDAAKRRVAKDVTDAITFEKLQRERDEARAECARLRKALITVLQANFDMDATSPSLDNARAALAGRPAVMQTEPIDRAEVERRFPKPEGAS